MKKYLTELLFYRELPEWLTPWRAFLLTLIIGQILIWGFNKLTTFEHRAYDVRLPETWSPAEMDAGRKMSPAELEAVRRGF
jgi:hypothetical protein